MGAPEGLLRKRLKNRGSDLEGPSGGVVWAPAWSLSCSRERQRTRLLLIPFLDTLLTCQSDTCQHLAYFHLCSIWERWAHLQHPPHPTRRCPPQLPPVFEVEQQGTVLQASDTSQRTGKFTQPHLEWSGNPNPTSKIPTHKRKPQAGAARAELEEERRKRRKGREKSDTRTQTQGSGDRPSGGRRVKEP